MVLGCVKTNLTGAVLLSFLSTIRVKSALLLWTLLLWSLIKVILVSEDEGEEEQMNMETFLKRKELRGHWEATGIGHKSYILDRVSKSKHKIRKKLQKMVDTLIRALSASHLITLQPLPDGKWAKIKARRYSNYII